MKLRVKTLTLFLSGFACFYGNVAFADDATTTTAAAKANPQDVDALIKKINAQEKALESQVASLKAEVKEFKSQQKQNMVKIQDNEAKAAKHDKALAARAHSILEMGPSPVITAPYIGIKPRYDASELVVNQPTYNEDVLLMQRDVAMDKAYKEAGLGSPNDHPIIELSGKVEGQALETKPFTGNSQSDINLSSTELDVIGHVSKWVNALISAKYDSGSPTASNTVSAQRISNSRLYIDHAFVNVGNLNITPFYATLGQRTVPFGHYGSYMLSDMYNAILFRTRERAILFGYQPMNNKGVYANVFGFKGDTKIGGGANNVNNYGADTGYLFGKGQWSGDIGFSGMANVADSNGMQNTGITDQTQFRGYGFSPNGTSNQENMQRRVPGADFHVVTSYGSWSLIGEWTGATSAFNAQDLTFNNHGAKPSAAHGEVVYAFNIGRYPSNVGVGYDHTWQALGLNIPQSRYIAVINSSFYKDTIASLELKHEHNYANSNTASGQLAPVVIPGHSSNTATFQFGVYF